MELFPPPEVRPSIHDALSPDKTTIVLDDEPMLFDEGSLVVEDDVAFATLEESEMRERAGDGWGEAEVIEVGDEVVFDR